MSKQLPVWIEPQRLAEKSSLLEGRISLSRMARVASSLFEHQGDLAVSLQFGVDENRQAVITGRINGEIILQCQRCMQAMPYTINCKVSLGIVHNDAQAMQLPGKYEALILDEEGKASLNDIIEDELILALPTVAMHDSAVCPAGDKFISTQSHENTEVDKGEQESNEKPNPFAVLEQLKKKGSD